jgi:hypothetical protein
MTIARQRTNWAAHVYVYLAVLALGLAMVHLALRGTDQLPAGGARRARRHGRSARLRPLAVGRAATR